MSQGPRLSRVLLVLVDSVQFAQGRDHVFVSDAVFLVQLDPGGGENAVADEVGHKARRRPVVRRVSIGPLV